MRRIEGVEESKDGDGGKSNDGGGKSNDGGEEIAIRELLRGALVAETNAETAATPLTLRRAGRERAVTAGAAEEEARRRSLEEERSIIVEKVLVIY